MKNVAHRGFTIVEMIIVIVVLSILVMITASIYQSAQVQARDARNIDGMDKFADAITLFNAKYQHYPRGSFGSTSAIGAGTECADGANGWVASTTYTCTVEDTLVASGYLPAGFVSSLSPNLSPGTTVPTNGRLTLMAYVASASATSPVVKKVLVMTSMEAPTAADTSHFNAEIVKCYGAAQATYAPRDSYGMRNGVCLTLQTF